MFCPQFTFSMSVAESKVLAQHLMLACQHAETENKERLDETSFCMDKVVSPLP